jgi:hypothetical protein
VIRLRQGVVAARALEPAVDALRAALPLGEPFHDPGVGLFGLRNAVMALGDTFVEVVTPDREGTAAGRFLDRRQGDGGYMLLLQVDDLGTRRARLRDQGVREAWAVELEDIAAVHLDPRDLPGAIVSLDQPEPPESWRWGGPEWRRTDGGRLTGAVLAAPDPAALAAHWADVLVLPLRDGPELGLDGGRIAFEAGGARPELAALEVETPRGPGRLDLRELRLAG